MREVSSVVGAGMEVCPQCCGHGQEDVPTQFCLGRREDFQVRTKLPRREEPVLYQVERVTCARPGT